MDERKPPLLPNELNLQPAPGRISAVVDSASADLATSDTSPAPGPRRQSGQSDPSREDLTNGRSVVYYGNEEEVSRGFLIALRAMGMPIVEHASEPPKPADTRAKP